MSTSRTFTPILGGGAGNAFQVGDKFGFQTVEKIRQALDLLGYCGLQACLGGDERGIIVTTGGTFQSVNAVQQYDLNGDTLGGFTLEVVMYYYTAAAATQVSLRLRNLQDSSNAAVSNGGFAYAGTSMHREIVTVTLASGIKTYSLEVMASDIANPVFGWGTLRFRKVAA